MYFSLEHDTHECVGSGLSSVSSRSDLGVTSGSYGIAAERCPPYLSTIDIDTTVLAIPVSPVPVFHDTSSHTIVCDLDVFFRSHVVG